MQTDNRRYAPHKRLRDRIGGNDSVFLDYLIMLFQLQKLCSFKYDKKTVTMCEMMGKDFVGDDHSTSRFFWKCREKQGWAWVQVVVQGPRLEIGTSWVRNSSANHRIAKFRDTSVPFRCLKIIFWRHFYIQSISVLLIYPAWHPLFSTLCGKDANQSLSFGFKNVNWNPTFLSTCSVQSTNTFYSAQNTTQTQHTNIPMTRL